MILSWPASPEQCVFYTTWSGAATADPASKNQAEQMLAEPEVRQFVEHLEKWIRRGVNQPSGEPSSGELSDATFDWMLSILRHQTTIFISDITIKDKRLTVRGGMLVALGADAAAATKRFHQNVRAFFLNLNVESIEVVSINGNKWYRVKPKAGFPTMTVGIQDACLIVAVGDDSLNMIFRRMRCPPPSWLVKARELANFERPTGLTYINLQRLREADHDPHRKEWLDLLGLSSSPWLVSASGLSGPDVVTRTVLAIEGEPRGLLLPASGHGLTREDVAAISDDATLALAVRLDVHKTIEALAAAAEKATPDIKQSLLKTLDTLLAGGGNNARQSVFASLGDRWCFYNSPSEGGLVMTGLTGVVPIKDRRQFSRSYETMMRLAAQLFAAGRRFTRRPTDPSFSFCRQRHPLREPRRSGLGAGLVGWRP